MNINAINEFSMKKNNLRLGESNPQPSPTVETPVAKPERVMTALHMQGMNNISFQASQKFVEASKKIAKKAAVALPLLIGAGALTTTTTSCDPDIWNPEPHKHPIENPAQKDSTVINIEINNTVKVDIDLDQSLIISWLEKLYNQGQISQDQNAQWQQEMKELIEKYGNDTKAYQAAMLEYAKQVALSSSTSAENTTKILAKIEEIETMFKNNEITWEEALKLLSQINVKLDTIIDSLDKIYNQNEAHHNAMVREQNKANELLDKIARGQELSIEEFAELKNLVQNISNNVDVIKGNTYDLIAIAKDPTRHNELIETIKNSVNDPVEFEKFEALFKFYGLTIADAITMSADQLEAALKTFIDRYEANEAENQAKLDEIAKKVGQLLDKVGSISNDLNTYYQIFDGYWTEALNYLENISKDVAGLKDLQKDANSMLNALLKKAGEFEELMKDNQGMTVDEFEAALQERDQRQYEKWVKFTIDMGLDKLAGDVATIKDLVAAMKGKLDGMKDYSAQLDRIIAKLDGIDLTAEENQEILKAIENAIKNHKCDCNCGDNGNHEGILGDVEDALNGLV